MHIPWPTSYRSHFWKPIVTEWIPFTRPYLKGVFFHMLLNCEWFSFCWINLFTDSLLSEYFKVHCVMISIMYQIKCLYIKNKKLKGKKTVTIKFLRWKTCTEWTMLDICKVFYQLMLSECELFHKKIPRFLVYVSNFEWREYEILHLLKWSTSETTLSR